MRVLLVEPYYTGSHRTWADGYQAFSHHEVELVIHEGRFWKWRMQGGFLTLAEEVKSAIAAGGSPHVLLVSDMVHLPSTSRSRVGMSLPACPWPCTCTRTSSPIHLCRANRTTSPTRSSTGRAWRSGTSCCSTPRSTGISGSTTCLRLLKHFPDYTHTHRIEKVAAKTEVLPVGVDLRRLDDVPSAKGGEPPLILWNQRWEYGQGTGGVPGCAGRACSSRRPVPRRPCRRDNSASSRDSSRRLPTGSVTGSCTSATPQRRPLSPLAAKRRHRGIHCPPGVLRVLRSGGHVRGCVPFVAQPAVVPGTGARGVPRPMPLRRRGPGTASRDASDRPRRSGDATRDTCGDGPIRLVGAGTPL